MDSRDIQFFLPQIDADFQFQPKTNIPKNQYLIHVGTIPELKFGA